ncbi:MAG: hypothetical protein AAB460_02675, partial [Patescibacteria group bacterium]
GEAHGYANVPMDLTVDPWVADIPAGSRGPDMALMAKRYGEHHLSGAPGPHSTDYPNYFTMGGCQPTGREVYDAYYAMDTKGAKNAGKKNCPTCLATWAVVGVRWAGCDLGRTDWPFVCPPGVYKGNGRR